MLYIRVYGKNVNFWSLPKLTNQTLYICEENLQYPDKVITKMSLKDNEDDFNNVHIMNPFVHKLKLENTFDKFKVRAKYNKILSIYL